MESKDGISIEDVSGPSGLEVPKQQGNISKCFQMVHSLEQDWDICQTDLLGTAMMSPSRAPSYRLFVGALCFSGPLWVDGREFADVGKYHTKTDPAVKVDFIGSLLPVCLTFIGPPKR